MGIKDFNKVILIGRNCADPEVREVGENKVVRIRVAVDKSYKKDGEWINQSDYIPVEAWSKTAEFLSNNLSKGDVVRIQGRLTTNQYEKDGEKRTSFFIKPDFGFDGVVIMEKYQPKDPAEKKTAEVFDDKPGDGVPF